MNKKAICICSGGLDSTVAYFYMMRRFGSNKIVPVNFFYGSKHNARERMAAEKIFGNKLVKIDIDLSFLNCSILVGGEDVPNGHYKDKDMKKTVIPFRNGILLSYAVAIAEDMKVGHVFYGAHYGDHHIYPDCRKEFVENFSKAAEKGTYKNVQIVSPFARISKDKIVKIGRDIGIEKEMSQTYSCYNGKEKHCGTCATCVERKEAFALANVKDYTLYEA